MLAKLVVNSQQFPANLPCLLDNAWPHLCQKLMEHLRLHAADERLKICRILRIKLSHESIVLSKQVSSQYSVSDPPPSSSSQGSLLLQHGLSLMFRYQSHYIYCPMKNYISRVFAVLFVKIKEKRRTLACASVIMKSMTW